MSESAAEDRARTMQVRALRRLSSCEVAGLGIALDQLETLEAGLVGIMPKLRRAAEQEAQVRRAKRQPAYAGPYVEAWRGVQETLELVSAAREETSYVEASGRVAKREHAPRLETA